MAGATGQALAGRVLSRSGPYPQRLSGTSENRQEFLPDREMAGKNIDPARRDPKNIMIFQYPLRPIPDRRGREKISDRRELNLPVREFWEFVKRAYPQSEGHLADICDQVLRHDATDQAIVAFQ
jgi:hypothetical protein